MSNLQYQNDVALCILIW